jgi:hypothetical protein
VLLWALLLSARLMAWLLRYATFVWDAEAVTGSEAPVLVAKPFTIKRTAGQVDSHQAPAATVDRFAVEVGRDRRCANQRTR